MSGELYACCCSDWSVSHSVFPVSLRVLVCTCGRMILWKIASHQLIRTVIRAWVRTAMGFSTVLRAWLQTAHGFFYVGFFYSSSGGSAVPSEGVHFSLFSHCHAVQEMYDKSLLATRKGESWVEKEDLCLKRLCFVCKRVIVILVCCVEESHRVGSHREAYHAVCSSALCN